MVNPPLEDENARVCNHHFTADDYVKSVLEGHGPAKPKLKATAVPTIFSFTKPVKRRKLSEARAAKSQHDSLIGDLLGSSSESSSQAVTIPDKQELQRGEPQGYNNKKILVHHTTR